MNSGVFAIAWRNLWRNKRRTWLTVSGIAFAVWMLVFSRSAQEGSFTIMVDNGARLLTGHIELQHPEYQDNPRLENTLRGVEDLITRIGRHPHVQIAAPRTQGFALASAGERSFGAQIMGVDPTKDSQWSSLPKMQPQGRYLTSSGETFMGSILASNLGVSIGDEIVLLGTAKRGGVAALVATLVGTFTTGVAALDRSLLQIPIDDFRDAWGLSQDEAHIIIVIADDVDTSVDIAKDFAGDGRVSLDWMTLMPDAEQMIELKKVGTQLFFALIAVIVTFSVANTFMMTVFERTAEFGMLMAIGMRPGSITIQLMLEAFWVCTLGIVIGQGLALAMILPLGAFGIPLPADASELLSQYNMPDHIYPAFSISAALTSLFVMYPATMLAALVPALRIGRMRPVDAIRTRE